MYVCASVLQHFAFILVKIFLGLVFLVCFVSHTVFKGNLMQHQPEYLQCVIVLVMNPE